MFECEIVTPESSLYKAPATFVAVPASDGEMGIMDKHVPYVATLGSGKVRVTLESGDIEQFVLLGGYAQVQSDGKVIVLADRAQDVSSIDRQAAKELAEQVRDKLDAAGEDAPERAYLLSELEWNKLLCEE